MQIETPETRLIDPQSASANALFSQGQQLLSERRAVRQALELFDSAQRLGYEPEECAAARWDCWMLLGNFERAWQESDFIASRGIEDPHCFWNGSPWKNKRVMLRCLHGLGDTIQFIRYAPLMKQACQSLTVQTHPQLVTTMECVPGVDRVCTWGSDYHENRSDWDMQMEVTELPRAFRTVLRSIPMTAPYIHIPQERIAWAAGHVQKNRRLRVGLAWEAGPWDPARSIDLAELSLLFPSQNSHFYSLQKGANLGSFRDDGSLFDLEANAADIRDTAALILNLDLVVTVDTMTAHLAGALGHRTWLLLPARADWRWMLDRADTPWYPSMRIFRQRKPGEWKDVLEEVRAALAEPPLQISTG